MASLMKVSTGLGSQQARVLASEGRAPHVQGHETAKQKDSCSWGTVEVNKKPNKNVCSDKVPFDFVGNAGLK